MALSRVWWPSPNYSSRGGYTVSQIVLHTTEGFTGENGIYDLAAYFSGPVGASSHVGIDNYHSEIVEMVSRENKAWTQCNCNPWCVAVEQCAYASWSRDTWLNSKGALLKRTAQWVAEEAAYFGIPVRELSQSQAQNGESGVTQHMHLGSAGCGHSDCGAGFPMDKVIEWALGGTSVAEPEGMGDVSASSDEWDGELFFACVGVDDRIYYAGPDTSGGWVMVDENSSARSGAHILVTSVGRVVITYTNQAGTVCTYERQAGGGSFAWAARGGNARLCRSGRGEGGITIRGGDTRGGRLGLTMLLEGLREGYEGRKRNSH